jgi:hypothetical protein
MANLAIDFPDGNGGTEHTDSKPNLGLRGGLVADFGITDNISFQPALLFVMKGAREEVDESETTFGITIKSTYQSKINLNYIQIPLNFQYHLNDDKTGFFVGAGPYIAYAFAGKYAIDGQFEISGAGFPTQTTTVKEDIDVEFGDEEGDMFKNLDLGVGLNAGYMLPMGVFVRAFGEYGFSNILPEFYASQDGKTRNYGFGLTVGYMIGGGK